MKIEDVVPSVNPKLDAMGEMLKTIHDLNERNKALKKQFTKAKEFLERFLGLGNLWDLDCKDYFPLRKEVKQFLKETQGL